jgi:hypothetical protein
MPSAKTPEARLFVAQVRAADPSAIKAIERALVDKKGNMVETAKLLGVSVAALYRWGDDVPAVSKVLEQHRRGRVGRGPGKAEPAKPAKRARKKAP